MTASVGGAAFDDVDVARCYRHRPPYPTALFERLFELSPGLGAALDLGCGPGKLAIPLSAWFLQVDAVDPSQPMLDEAAESEIPNIRWIHGSAEEAPLVGPYDLATAGASIHWMDHATVFPRLARLLPSGPLVVVSGDDAQAPPWHADWIGFITRWTEQLGGVFDPARHHAAMTAFEPWLDIEGRESIVTSFEQPVRDFIACQHSRQSFTRARLGPEGSIRYDAELGALLARHARGGLLHFDVETSVVWGRPRTTARAGAEAAAPL